MQTLMSTDIFNATNTGWFGNTIELGALRLYITISLPLVLMTLLAWYGVHWWETRKEELCEEQCIQVSYIVQEEFRYCLQSTGQQGFSCLMALLFLAANICWIGSWLESLPFAQRMLGVMLRLDFDMSEGRSDPLTSIQKDSRDVAKCQYERWLYYCPDRLEFEWSSVTSLGFLC